MTPRIAVAFAAAATVAVVAAVSGGLWLLGSPQAQREQALDERRVGALRGLARNVDLFWTRHQRLPQTLEELSHERGVRVDLGDAETGEPYRYRTLDDTRYELCASFARASAARGATSPGDFWQHGAGTQCYTLSAKAVGR